MTDSTWLDTTAQAELVRRGDATPRELVDEAIVRIEAVNPQLDAVIRTRFEEARREADRLPRTDDGRMPFRGVPVLFKDLGCHVAGEPTAHGVGAMVDVPRPVTSHLAELFVAAGFVCLGRTNVPEVGSTVTTEAKSFPPARNPWNPAHSTGGSSGGSAAAVASGMVAVAHANDGGGSIRIPASCCGLVGLKPSRGRTSLMPDYSVVDVSAERTARVYEMCDLLQRHDMSFAFHAADSEVGAAILDAAAINAGVLELRDELELAGKIDWCSVDSRLLPVTVVPVGDTAAAV